MNKSQLQKIGFLAVSSIVILSLFLVLHGLQSAKNTSAEAEIREGGAQVIEIFAKNGYTPTTIQAKADTPTILRIQTENTYDCSAALIIPDLNYEKFLQPTATSDVQILPQKAGTEILGSCSMGMYGFKINFV